MSYHGQPRGSFSYERDSYDRSRKPQLPNFDNFLRATGHAELALRAPPKLETTISSPPFGQSPLPTPPYGLHNGWLAEGRQDLQRDRQCAVLEEHEMPPIEPHRRASLMLPDERQPPPRPTRAYSSTNANAPQVDVMSWQHGRVIQEEEVPGKGLCYVYNDGTMCPKEVNGDAVNPKWGTTKAGKPRKRLGKACNTCREKKIKCDPGYPKCSQCLRFHRECRFDTNARQGHGSPKFRTSTDSPGNTSTCSPKEYIPSRKSSIAPTEASTPTDVVHRTLSRSSDGVLSPTMSERQMIDAPTPSKRQRLNAELDERPADSHHPRRSRDEVTDDMCNHGFGPEVDPAIANAKLTRQYLDLYMEYINAPTFEIFPKGRFAQWAMNNHNKSLSDRIMLYALMAWGTIHSNDPKRANHRAIFKSIVHQQLDRLEAQYSLQLVHTFLCLCFAEFADQQHEKGFSIFVRCIGAIAFLKLNIEAPSSNDCTAYDFSPTMYAECRRRTYWAAFCTDTYSGLARGDPRMLRSTDVYLRLPCASELYEKDQIPDMPTFDQETVLPQSMTSKDHVSMANMVYLIQIASICGDVQHNAWRSQNFLRVGRRPISDRTTREKLESRLEDWAHTYNVALRAKEGETTDSTDRPTNPRDLGGARAIKFAGLDMLFHWAHMELNRRVYHKSLPREEILRHARNATVHAAEVLKLSKQLLEPGGPNTRDYHFVTRGPLAGYAVHAAIDIVTAAGKTRDVLEPNSKIMNLMYHGLEFLEVLSSPYGSAKLQHMQVKERIQAVFNSAQAAANQRKTYFFCTEPMVYVVDKEVDLIYGSDRQVYLQAGYNMNNTINDSEIFEISARDRPASGSRTEV
ncbi:hypothetical protein OHC33_007811 [Knufia fluminis]|uniref:Zn(2)-C6 fungal-type domain-containing protein n=1 Tax=Knufia fluminis TaxID=191047 RepID=A0AAN8ES90_9EURO|nr:hypothetical protein OHC33_007811 [Knufia fluminis]